MGEEGDDDDDEEEGAGKLSPGRSVEASNSPGGGKTRIAHDGSSAKKKIQLREGCDNSQSGATVGKVALQERVQSPKGSRRQVEGTAWDGKPVDGWPVTPSSWLRCVEKALRQEAPAGVRARGSPDAADGLLMCFRCWAGWSLRRMISLCPSISSLQQSWSRSGASLPLSGSMCTSLASPARHFRGKATQAVAHRGPRIEPSAPEPAAEDVAMERQRRLATACPSKVHCARALWTRSLGSDFGASPTGFGSRTKTRSMRPGRSRSRLFRAGGKWLR